MTADLSFHDARRILALLAHAPDGRVKLVDGTLSVEAFLGTEASRDDAKEAPGTATIASPAVGIFRVPTGAAAQDGRTIGVVEAPRRIVSVETELGGTRIETLVEDGAFVEFGTPIAVVHLDADGP